MLFAGRVGDQRSPEAAERRALAMDADRQLQHLRRETLGDVLDHRFARNAKQPLMRAAHPPRRPARQDHAGNPVLCVDVHHQNQPISPNKARSIRGNRFHSSAIDHTL